LYWEGAELVLSDLGSRNGTFLNARRIERAPVRLGDVVRWGGSVALITDQPGATSELAPGLIAGPLLRAALSEAERAAPSDLPVILEGETGTGKEVVARTIHGWSRRSGAFLAVNCAAHPPPEQNRRDWFSSTPYRAGSSTSTKRRLSSLYASVGQKAASPAGQDLGLDASLSPTRARLACARRGPWAPGDCRRPPDRRPLPPKRQGPEARHEATWLERTDVAAARLAATESSFTGVRGVE
jgi:hypothetical protein